MAAMKTFPNAAALLLDVVGSRGSARNARHDALVGALSSANESVQFLDALRFTVGDEIQGVYATARQALYAAYVLRLAVAPEVDLRVGIGLGDVEVIDESRGIQDGSAWWNARQAITEIREMASEPGYRHVRTAITGEGIDGLDAVARLIDSGLGRLRGGTVRTLHGLLQGMSNAEIAEAEGISESANSQRVINNDLRPLADAILALRQ